MRTAMVPQDVVSVKLLVNLHAKPLVLLETKIARILIDNNQHNGQQLTLTAVF